MCDQIEAFSGKRVPRTNVSNNPVADEFITLQEGLVREDGPFHEMC